MAHCEPTCSAGCADDLGTIAGCDTATSETPVGVEPAAAPEGAGCADGVSSEDTESQGEQRPQSLREFERALRRLGFSRQQAANLSRFGWDGLNNEQVNPASELASLHAAIERLQAAIQKGPRP